jgi:glycosyltransferase involved in cell wall biosynthesis
MTAPKVSIGMPVFNGARTLRESIASVADQTYTDFELIISDNASTDETADICREIARRDARILYQRHATNVGAAANFNHVFRQSRGEYFKWMAADDLIHPRFLERTVKVLDEAPPSVVLAFPLRRHISHDGNPVEGEPWLVNFRQRPTERLHDLDYAELVGVCGSRCPMFVFGLQRANAMRKTRLIGDYIAADVVYVAELRLTGRFWLVPEVLYAQRLHPETREVNQRLTPGGEAAWFGSRRVPRSPELRLLREQLEAIWRSDLAAPNKLVHTLDLRRHVALRTARSAKFLARRQGKALWRVWSKLSLEATRAHPQTLLPLRIWMLAGSIRTGNSVQAKRVLYGKSNQTELLTHAAGKLARRREEAADELLLSWLRAGPEPCRAAARAALLGEREDLLERLAEARV